MQQAVFSPKIDMRDHESLFPPGHLRPLQVKVLAAYSKEYVFHVHLIALAPATPTTRPENSIN